MLVQQFFFAYRRLPRTSSSCVTTSEPFTTFMEARNVLCHLALVLAQ